MKLLVHWLACSLGHLNFFILAQLLEATTQQTNAFNEFLHIQNVLSDCSNKLFKTSTSTEPCQYDWEQMTQNITQLANSKTNIKSIRGCLVGMAVSDAFYKNSTTGSGDSTVWEWTTYTSMALCIATSYVLYGKHNANDQFIRYLYLYEAGYLDASNKSQKQGRVGLPSFKDYLSVNPLIQHQEFVKWMDLGVLACVASPAIIFHSDFNKAATAVESARRVIMSDESQKDATNLFTHLIWNAINEKSRETIINTGTNELGLSDINGIFKNASSVASFEDLNKYVDDKMNANPALNGKLALLCVLWAFANDGNDFSKGVEHTSKLGQKLDCIPVMYGMLAGACYGVEKIPAGWKNITGYNFINAMADVLSLRNELQIAVSDNKKNNNTQVPPNDDKSRTGQSNPRKYNFKKIGIYILIGSIIGLILTYVIFNHILKRLKEG